MLGRLFERSWDMLWAVLSGPNLAVSSSPSGGPMPPGSGQESSWSASCGAAARCDENVLVTARDDAPTLSDRHHVLCPASRDTRTVADVAESSIPMAHMVNEDARLLQAEEKLWK